MTIDPEDPLAVAVVEAIRAGDLEGLRRLLDTRPGLATARIGTDGPGGTTRSLLHVATDWPGTSPAARPPWPCWSRRAAHRLVERGARTAIDDAATLGLLDRLEGYFTGTGPAPGEVDRAFWGACHGGQRACAEHLLEWGADPNWVPPWEPLTPLDAAARSGADDLVNWLRTRGRQAGRRPGRDRPAEVAPRDRPREIGPRPQHQGGTG